MPFPVVFTSSAPAGGRPSADFGGPVLFGKVSDGGPVGTGPQPQPSGTLYVQSTGGQSNQMVSTGAIGKASLPYVPISSASLVGAGAPPFTGFGAAMALIGASTAPFLQVYSTLATDWVPIFAQSTVTASTGSAAAGLQMTMGNRVSGGTFVTSPGTETSALLSITHNGTTGPTLVLARMQTFFNSNSTQSWPTPATGDGVFRIRSCTTDGAARATDDFTAPANINYEPVLFWVDTTGSTSGNTYNLTLSQSAGTTAGTGFDARRLTLIAVSM